MSDNPLLDLGDRLILNRPLGLLHLRLLDRVLLRWIGIKCDSNRRLTKKPPRQVHLGAHHDGRDADMQGDDRKHGVGVGAALDRGGAAGGVSEHWTLLHATLYVRNVTSLH